jgi:ATP-binding cassette subfamily B protein
MRDFKTNMCEHIVRLPMRYHDSKPSGELLSLLSNDMNCLSGIYDWNLFQVLRSITGGAAGVVLMAVIDWRFAAVVFTLGTASVCISSHFSKKLEASGSELQACLGKTSTDAYELVRAAKTIRLFHLENKKQEQFNDTAESEAAIRIKSGIISTKMNSAITAVNTLSYIAVLFAGALFVYLRLSDWGKVIALLSLKGTCDMLFVECGLFMAGMQTNVAGIKRIFEVLDAGEEQYEDISVTANSCAETLKMENICFAYDENTPVLQNFNLTLRRNAVTALVGESGSGKSTVMKLLLGLYTPDSGEIYTVEKNLRRITAYIAQEPMLFRGTVYENIAFGNPGANTDDVMNAVKMAGADEFIANLENGYETVLNDNGASLSGGQKQRIAIARALVKDAPVLLFDEITSALDRGTEELVCGTVKHISRYKTVLFITHRPDVIKWADEVKKMS